MHPDTQEKDPPTVSARAARFPPLRRRVLHDGHPVIVRALRPDDSARYADFVRGLSPATLYNRLLSAGVGITPERLQRLLLVDQQTHVAVAAIVRRDGDVDEIVGVARFVIESDGTTAEFAVTIADEWQHRGVGTMLLRTQLVDARRVGVELLVGDVFAANTSMLALLRKLGFAQASSPGDAQLLRVTRALAPRPRQASFRTAPRRAPGRRPHRQ